VHKNSVSRIDRIGFLRATAWLLLFGVTTLSLVPPLYRPTMPIAHSLEHAAIFFATGLIFGLGYRCRQLLQAAGLIVFAGVIEVAQFLVPGRHARMSDFVVDAVSVSLGVLTARLTIRAVGPVPSKRPEIR
jgi:VanZ family protein